MLALFLVDISKVDRQIPQLGSQPERLAEVLGRAVQLAGMLVDQAAPRAKVGVVGIRGDELAGVVSGRGPFAQLFVRFIGDPAQPWVVPAFLKGGGSVARRAASAASAARARCR